MIHWYDMKGKKVNPPNIDGYVKVIIDMRSYAAFQRIEFAHCLPGTFIKGFKICVN